MKKIITLASSLLILVIIILVMINFWLRSAPPASVNEAENAVATKDLIMLAHVNNRRINSLMGTIGSDPKSLDIPMFNDDVFSEFYYGVSELGKNTEQVIFSINGDKKISYNLLMKGNFEWESIKIAIDKYFQVNAITDNTYKLTKRDVDDGIYVCPDDRVKVEQQELYVYTNEQWLVISTKQQQLSLITKRLSSQQNADVDLSKWRNFRNNHLASMALLVPKNAPKITKGFTAMMVKKAVNTNQDISSAYFGIDLNLLEIGININNQINASVDWVKNAKSIAQQHIQTMKKDANSISPTLANLLNNLSIEEQHESLITRLTLKEQDIAKINDVFTEVIATAFSFSGSNKVTIEQESIQESPWNYRTNDQVSTSVNFKANEFFGIPALVDGPLALSLGSVSVDEKLGLLTLDINGAKNMPKIEGWWNNAKVAFTLKIDSVTNSEGDGMMRDERCVKDLGFMEANHKVATNFQTNNEIASVQKSIRLKQDSQLKDIANIKGVLEFSIPRGVQTIDLELKKEASYQQHGIRFYLNDFTQQSISYQLSGEKEKLVEVRALNNKGQALKFSYSSGIGDKKTINYRGDVAKIQLFIATKNSTHKSQFNLTADTFFAENKIKDYYLSVRPTTVSKKQWFSYKNKRLKESNVMAYLERDKYYSKIKIASWYQSPVGMLMSHDSKSTWNSSINYQLAMPLISELSYNLQAFEIKTQHKAEQMINYFAISPYTGINDDQSKGEYKPHQKVDGIGFLKGGRDIKLDIKPQQKISALSGQLNINLPQKIATVNVGKPGFTPSVFDHEVTVSLLRINGGFIPRYQYKVSAPNLINMIAVLDDGKELLPTQSTFENGYWQLQYPLTQKINHFEVLVAAELAQVTYPFKITPIYQ